MFSLIYTLEDQECELPLQDGATLTIGRSSKCDLTITDPSVSGKHVEILVQGKNVICRDLGSSNGTYIGGQKITQAGLPLGRSVRLGRFKLRLTLPGGVIPEPAAPAAPSPSPAVGQATPPAGMAPAAAGVPTPEPGAPIEAEVVSVSGGNPMETPPAGVAPAAGPAPALPAVVEVSAPAPMPLAQVSEEPVDSPEDNRKKMIRLVGAAGITIGLVLILAASLLKKAPPPPKVDPPYTAETFRADLVLGMEAFTQRVPDFAKAQKVWEGADAAWRKQKLDTRRRPIARKLASVAKVLAEAAKSTDYSPVDWVQIAQTLGDLYQDGDYPDDLELFLKHKRTWALSQGASQSILRKAERALAENKFEEAIKIAKEIQDKSLFIMNAVDLIERAEGKIAAAERKAVVDLATEKRYRDAITAAKVYMEKWGQDKNLSAELATWETEVSEQATLRRAEKLVENGKLQDLKEAVQLYESIPQKSRYRQRAADRIDLLKQRMIMLEARALYQSGNEQALRDLVKTYPALKGNSQYLSLLRRVESIKKRFAAADELVKKKDFLGAREQWEAIRELESERKNPWNMKARAGIREYSLERIGNEWVEASGILAAAKWKKGNYARARRLLVDAREKCQVDVDEEESAMIKRASGLYQAAQRRFNMKQRHEGILLLEQSLECLLTTDALYERIKKFYNKQKGAFE
ncbi:MAG: FHA domain-containing protein [Planctomycetota bacterium]|jgi:hypothetical protein